MSVENLNSVRKLNCLFENVHLQPKDIVPEVDLKLFYFPC